LTFEQIRTFCTVAQLLSFSEAAKVLHVSQPTVSHQISTLEKIYNAEFFDRSSKQISLTQAGKIFYIHAQNILENLDAIPKHLAEANNLESGSLTVGVCSLTGNCFLYPILKSFRERFPRIYLSIRSGTYFEILSALKQGSIDVALLGHKSDFPPDSQLNYSLIKKTKLVLITCPSHPWHNLKKILPYNFIGQTFIHFRPSMPIRHAVESFIKEKGISITSSLEVGDPELAKLLVKKGMGICITSEMSVIEELVDGSLVKVNLDGLETKFHYIMSATSRKKQISVATKTFLETVHQITSSNT